MCSAIRSSHQRCSGVKCRPRFPAPTAIPGNAPPPARGRAPVRRPTAPHGAPARPGRPAPAARSPRAPGRAPTAHTPATARSVVQVCGGCSRMAASSLTAVNVNQVQTAVSTRALCPWLRSGKIICNAVISSLCCSINCPERLHRRARLLAVFRRKTGLRSPRSTLTRPAVCSLRSWISASSARRSGLAASGRMACSTSSCTACSDLRTQSAD